MDLLCGCIKPGIPSRMEKAWLVFRWIAFKAFPDWTEQVFTPIPIASCPARNAANTPLDRIMLNVEGGGCFCPGGGGGVGEIV